MQIILTVIFKHLLYKFDGMTLLTPNIQDFVLNLIHKLGSATIKYTFGNDIRFHRSSLILFMTVSGMVE